MKIATDVGALIDLTPEEGHVMRGRIQTRLSMLRMELEKGQVELEVLERQRTYIRETGLRISGAIQVLEELLAEDQLAGQSGVDPGATQPATAQANESNT